MSELLREYFLEILGAIAAAGATFWAYVTGRKRAEAETEQIKSGALQGIQSVYDKFVTDTKSKIEELITEIESLTHEVKDLRITVGTLEKDLDDCRKGISKLKK